MVFVNFHITQKTAEIKNRIQIACIGRYILFFLIPVLISSVAAVASQKTLVFDLKGINIHENDAIVLTEKLRNALSKTGKYSICNPSELGVADSISKELVSSYDKETAYKIAPLINASILIWGNIGKVGNRYIMTVVVLSKSENGMSFDSYQEEIEGKLPDVLEHSVQGIVEKITGEADTVEKKQLTDAGTEVVNGNKNIGNTVFSGECGWLEIKEIPDDAKIYVNGEYIGTGECKAKLPVGVHRVTAKTEDDTKTEFVEIFKNDVSAVEMEIGDTRNVRFAMTFEGSWLLGEHKEFGPCHSFGFKIKDKHFFGLNYYWGFPVVGNTWMFGGGIIYTYAINIKHIFISEFGVTTGFWREENWSYSGDSYYFGGPKIRLQVGYKYVFLFNEFTLLIGNDTPKMLLNSGISFIM